MKTLASMKTLALAILFTVAAAPAWAGTVTASSPTTTKQDNALAGLLADTNAATCARKSLPASCTDADFVAAGGHAGSVFATVDALMSDWLKNRIRDVTQEQRERKRAQLGTWIDDAATAAQKNAICAAWGMPNGCLY